MFPLRTLTGQPNRNVRCCETLAVAARGRGGCISLIVADGAIGMIDGQSVVAVAHPDVNSSRRRTTGDHLDEMPRAAGLGRALFFSDPPSAERTEQPRPRVQLLGVVIGTAA